MVGKSTNRNTPLLPDRHPIQDFFICDVTDAIPKDDIGSMEHPIFSLATKPDLTVREYEHNGVRLTVIPSTLGLATIHDKDILIYCISQLIAKMNAGFDPHRTLHIKAYDLLVSTNRNIDGRGYEQLVSALDRLSGTRLRTNIKTGGEEITSGFGLIDSWNIIRHSDSGRMAEIRINLSDWVFNAVIGREVLTLHRDYFRLRKPLERRMYELARKHCGKQDEWAISLELLRKKCGSASSEKEFRRLVSQICSEDAQHGHVPDYAVALEGDTVRFINRGALPALQAVQATAYPVLDPETYHDARTVAPGYDVYLLEEQWRSFWVESGQPELKNPDAAFLGFCRSRYNRKPVA
ncbi:replication initiator protein A [Tautonia marina]|uniref:replication initiator protein A n=1 Tax=Tautonia marina TaxID=2653855 RepID=UPI001260E8AC|nr:replication initiator protein A [Tautonia marina]